MLAKTLGTWLGDCFACSEVGIIVRDELKFNLQTTHRAPSPGTHGSEWTSVKNDSLDLYLS